MALQNLVGQGIWLPTPYASLTTGASPYVSTFDETLDADEEELQLIGRVVIDGGGSKTFGTSSSIGWYAGASNTFQASATLRIGVKTPLDTTGPPARATIGAAAFNVYDDLIGGTDTITSTAWRTETMSAGTPFSVAHGDLLAVCFHLDIVSAAQSVRPRMSFITAFTGFPLITFVTSGPTYSLRPTIPNVILTFNDGTLGWLDQSYVQTVTPTTTGTIGNGNIYANIFQVPFSCKVDMLGAAVNATTSAADFALELYSTPLGTPALIESVAFDANIIAAAAANRFYIGTLTTPRTLTINTDYAVGIKQTTATSVTSVYSEVNDANHFKVRGMGAQCYAALSTAGATFASQGSGKRRAECYVRISALDDGAGGGAVAEASYGLGI